MKVVAKERIFEIQKFDPASRSWPANVRHVTTRVAGIELSWYEFGSFPAYPLRPGDFVSVSQKGEADRVLTQEELNRDYMPVEQEPVR